VFQTTGSTKILEGKLRRKATGKGHTVSSTGNTEIVCYGPENTVYATIKLKQFAHVTCILRSLKMHSCVNYSLPLVLVLQQIKKTIIHMKMKKCFVIK